MGKFWEGVKKGAGKASEFANRIEFAPEDRQYKAERLFGLDTGRKPPKPRKTTTKKKSVGKKKTSSKRKTYVKSLPVKRTPTRTPKISQPTKIKDSMPATSNGTNGTFVKMMRDKSPATKKYGVTYRKGSGKYSRQWFSTVAEAEQFARKQSKEYNTTITYE